jgi:hypothetical protein
MPKATLATIRPIASNPNGTKSDLAILSKAAKITIDETIAATSNSQSVTLSDVTIPSIIILLIQ